MEVIGNGFYQFFSSGFILIVALTLYHGLDQAQ